MRIDQCRDVVELATAYLEDALPPEEARAVEAHLAGCPGCTTYVDQMRRTVRELGSLEDDPLPAEVRTALLEALRDRRRTT
ncbi:anti-sigma factor [Mumia zhuanghuii]|uniref:Anti-sigma factor family protein n=2 Tax=Mumia TaxID=1546255 RepID=A0ABW1QR60_9ACTN|nr:MULTISPECIES: zf-HC2 domain-containing protein [Mumia]KAA1423765.1 anti-sigma factor [Mumia zhuanghuii]